MLRHVRCCFDLSPGYVPPVFTPSARPPGGACARGALSAALAAARPTTQQRHTRLQAEMDDTQWHLFGLSSATHLNGLSARLLEEEPDSGGRQAVEVTLGDGRLLCVRARPANVGRRASEGQVVHVLSSQDMAEQIVVACGAGILLTMSNPTFNAHGTPDLSAIARIAAVNRAFSWAAHSDELWRAICEARWACKWGFDARMRRAPSSGWRASYMAEERDAKRQSIQPSELYTLRFDFRFWLEPTQMDGFFETGLRRSLSSEVRLLPGVVEDYWDRDRVPLSEKLRQYEARRPTAPGCAASGCMLGHPNSIRGDGRPIAWFLDEDGRGVQWGYLPHLWPKGVVRRLPSWGWEIANPNVCLRALDMRGGTGPDDEFTYLVSPTLLWGDALASLSRKRFRLAPPGGRILEAILPSAGQGMPGVQVLADLGPHMVAQPDEEPDFGEIQTFE